MKFNEKLINLRKKEGMSQEELGYKLNVTRQTVSKWELGQTTPEMDKLIEIGKIFNTSVDELINDSKTSNENNVVNTNNDITPDTHNNINDGNTNTNSNSNTKINDQPIGKKSKREMSIITIIAIVLVAIIIVILIKIFTGFTLFKKVTDTATNTQKDSISNFSNFFDKIIDKANQGNEEFNISSFNSPIEMYQGTVVGSSVNSTLDKVIISNKKNDKKITVKFNEVETENTEEIKNIKNSIIYSDDYELSFDYDKDGYINKVTIEKAAEQISEFDIKRFNMSFEIYAGSNMGGSITSILDKVITSNKTNERKITVKYKGTQTQEESKIIDIKKQIDTFSNYNVSYDYDANGFINKVTIENL